MLSILKCQDFGSAMKTKLASLIATAPVLFEVVANVGHRLEVASISGPMVVNSAGGVELCAERGLVLVFESSAALKALDSWAARLWLGSVNEALSCATTRPLTMFAMVSRLSHRLRLSQSRGQILWSKMLKLKCYAEL